MKWTTVAAAGLLSPLALVSCGSSEAPVRQGTSTHAIYSSATEAAAQSDAVFLGRMTGEIGRAEVGTKSVDGPSIVPGPDGEPTPVPGLPMVFYSFQVESVLAGDAPAREIVVGWLDEAKYQTDDLRPLGDGRVVLFLDSLSSSDWQPIDALIDGTFYIPVTGSDNGVMDVSGDVATARSADMTSLTGTRERDDDPSALVVELPRLKDAISAGS